VVKLNLFWLALRRGRRVGFNCRFGVKLAGLWALEGISQPTSGSANCLKKLTEVSGTGKKPQNVTNITLTDAERK
jgi:hypothetical protein